METYWVWEYGLFEKNPKRQDSFNPETTLEVVKAADAQATIAALTQENERLKQGQAIDLKNNNDYREQLAALQARVKELEQAVKETHGRFISEQAAKKDVIDELTVALKSDADGQVLFDKLMQDALKLESQLTRRTAELERVRGERDEYAHKTKMLCLQNGPLMIENHDMKKLIAALPKVEGAVVVSNGYVKDSTRCHALFGADEDAALYAALLQHRQGMEG